MQCNKMVEDNILDFLSVFCAVHREVISLDSEVVKHLKMEGDDAVELIDTFSKKFDVDMSSFEKADYFISEASFNPIVAIVKILKKDTKLLKVMYVRDLIEAAYSKKWKE